MSETVTEPGVKPAKAAKDSKKTKSPDEGKGATLQRLAHALAALQDEVRALRAQIDAAPPHAPTPPVRKKAATEAPLAGDDLQNALREPIDAAVAFGVFYRAQPDGVEASTTRSLTGGLTELLDEAGDKDIARLAYALSSPPKVALVRSLLRNGGRGAAQLGNDAGLSTGSLYHHLRELVHADFVHTERGRYTLTWPGRTIALLLFAAATEPNG